MSNAVSALGGETHDGFAAVSDAGLRGMITVRGDLSSRRMASAIRATTGCDMPGTRRIAMNGDRGVAWMSPDELLVFVPYADAPAAAVTLTTSLEGDHALVADVSDARAVFTLTGAKADQVIRKLSPADIDRLEPGEIRRTRIAQVAGAFWRSAPDEITLVTFRSVAAYVMDVLAVSARPGSELSRRNGD